MEKKLKPNYLLITLLLIACTVQGQRRGRWYQIEKNDVKTAFVDTTTMNVSDEQISVWVLEIYNEPFDIENSSSQAKRSRTQYLFNIPGNSYTVVGNLFYDEIGKIISQNYNPIIGGGARILYEPVSDDENVADIYYKVAELAGVEIENPEEDMALTIDADSAIAQRIDSLNDRTVDSFAQDSSGIPADEEVSDQETESGTVEIDQPVQAGITLRENNIGPDTDPVDLPYKTSDIPEGARVAQIYDPATGDYIEIISSDESPAPAEAPETEVITEEEPPEYDLANETNVTNTIFTDGHQFCFQVSSWKRKNIAEQEVRRLKAKGHNAYYVEAHPRNKRGTWYRVRIGYFNSREEAREYQRNLR